MRRNSRERERNCRRLSTRIRREAWRQAERKRKTSTEGTDVGERQEEGKRKDERLSSQTQTKVDERKLTRGKSPKAKAKGTPVERLWERNREG